MGVSLTVFVGVKFTLNGKSMSSLHQRVLTHEDLNKRKISKSSPERINLYQILRFNNLQVSSLQTDI